MTTIEQIGPMAGKVKVTITGTLAQVRDTLLRVEPPIEVDHHDMERKTRIYEEAQAKRRLIRQAFDLIRYDSWRQPLVQEFARTLGGSLPMTDTVLETARRVVLAEE